MGITNKINREDVNDVARQLRMSPTYEQVTEVLEMYDEQENNDPGGIWNLIVENCLYNFDKMATLKK